MDPSTRSSVLAFVLVLAWSVAAVPAPAQAPLQTQADSYTRYDLQDPDSHAFRIVYDVSATTPGAVRYFNAIRVGAEESVHGVTDLMTGGALSWEVVDGATARGSGHPRASLEGRYIMVELARPVPPSGGEARLRIDKTYVDEESYYSEGADIVFSRSLGIPRNSVVLPAGYELVSVNHPSQVRSGEDGRIHVSFMNRGPGALELEVRARPLPAGSSVTSRRTGPVAEPLMTTVREPATARTGYEFSERAFQDREIVYFLQQPETHAFRLYHDYTETRPGTDRYLNVVRAGSAVSDPSARILDTGERLRVETLRGRAIVDRGVDIGRDPDPETEVVVIWFDPVLPGHSVRVRIEETYTDPGRYLLVGDELVWDRRFGRPRNAVVLPEGWYLTANAVPATVSPTEDGRVRLDYENDRPDDLAVFIKARRR